MEQLTPFALMALMLVAFWLLILRPQRRRQVEHQKKVESLRVGVRVMLASGVYATVTELGEKTMRAEIAAGVEIEVLRQAVAEVVTAPGATDAPAAAATPTGPCAAAPAEEAVEPVDPVVPDHRPQPADPTDPQTPPKA